MKYLISEPVKHVMTYHTEMLDFDSENAAHQENKTIIIIPSGSGDIKSFLLNIIIKKTQKS